MKFTLCGSARFEKEYHYYNEKLSLMGHVVYSLSVLPSQKGGCKTWYTSEQKITLDKVHKQKIMESDAAFLVSPTGYIGESTLSELMYACSIKKLLFMDARYKTHRGHTLFTINGPRVVRYLFEFQYLQL